MSAQLLEVQKRNSSSQAISLPYYSSPPLSVPTRTVSDSCCPTTGSLPASLSTPLPTSLPTLLPASLSTPIPAALPASLHATLHDTPHDTLPDPRSPITTASITTGKNTFSFVLLINFVSPPWLRLPGFASFEGLCIGVRSINTKRRTFKQSGKLHTFYLLNIHHLSFLNNLITGTM